MTFQPFTDFTEMTVGEMNQYLDRLVAESPHITYSSGTNEKGYPAYKMRNLETGDMVAFELGDEFDIFQHKLKLLSNK